MKLGFSKAEEDFRAECAEWLTAQMAGEFADIKGITTLTAKSERRKEVLCVDTTASTPSTLR